MVAQVRVAMEVMRPASARRAFSVAAGLDDGPVGRRRLRPRALRRRHQERREEWKDSDKIMEQTSLGIHDIHLRCCLRHPASLKLEKRSNGRPDLSHQRR
jgi:hypothetical protein